MTGRQVVSWLMDKDRFSLLTGQDTPFSLLNYAVSAMLRQAPLQAETVGLLSDPLVEGLGAHQVGKRKLPLQVWRAEV